MKNQNDLPANYKSSILISLLLIFTCVLITFAILCLAFIILPIFIVRDSAEPIETIEAMVVTVTPPSALPFVPTTCPSVPSNWRKVVEDDFVDDKNYWYPGAYRNQDIDVYTKIEDSLFQIDIRSDHGGFYSTDPYRNATAQDFYMSVLARKVGGNTEAGYGVTFRIVGDQLLFFRIQDSGSVQVQARDIDLNWLPPFFTNQISNLNPEGYNQLSVFVQKDHYVLCVNNVSVGEIQDSTYQLGQLGIGVDLIVPNNDDFQVKLKNTSGYAEFEFDKFIVYIPPKP